VDYLEIKPSAQRVIRTFEEQINAANEIQTRKSWPIEEQERTAYRTANKMVCNSCSFKDLCTMELSGGNVPLLMRTEYRQRTRRQFNEVSEENDG